VLTHSKLMLLTMQLHLHLAFSMRAEFSKLWWNTDIIYWQAYWALSKNSSRSSSGKQNHYIFTTLYAAGIRMLYELVHTNYHTVSYHVIFNSGLDAWFVEKTAWHTSLTRNFITRHLKFSFPEVALSFETQSPKLKKLQMEWHCHTRQ